MAKLPTRENLSRAQKPQVRSIIGRMDTRGLASGYANLGRGIAQLGAAFASIGAQQDAYDAEIGFQQFAFQQQNNLNETMQGLDPAELPNFADTFADTYRENARTFYKTVPESQKAKVEQRLFGLERQLYGGAAKFQRSQQQSISLGELEHMRDSIYAPRASQSDDIGTVMSEYDKLVQGNPYISPAQKGSMLLKGRSVLEYNHIQGRIKRGDRPQDILRDLRSVPPLEDQRQIEGTARDITGQQRDRGPIASPKAIQKLGKVSGISLKRANKANILKVAEVAEKAGYDPVLAAAIGHYESAGSFSTTMRPVSKRGTMVRGGKRVLSSALGIFQFLDSNQREFGYGDTAEAQTEAFIKKNNREVASVEKSIGRKLTPHEKYLTHFQGPKGAAMFLKADSKESVRTVLQRIGGKKYASRVLQANSWMRNSPNVGSFLSKVNNVIGTRMKALETAIYPAAKAAPQPQVETADVKPVDLKDETDAPETEISPDLRAEQGGQEPKVEEEAQVHKVKVINYRNKLDANGKVVGLEEVEEEVGVPHEELTDVPGTEVSFKSAEQETGEREVIEFLNKEFSPDLANMADAAVQQQAQGQLPGVSDEAEDPEDNVVELRPQQQPGALPGKEAPAQPQQQMLQPAAYQYRYLTARQRATLESQLAAQIKKGADQRFFNSILSGEINVSAYDKDVKKRFNKTFNKLFGPEIDFVTNRDAQEAAVSVVARTGIVPNRVAARIQGEITGDDPARVRAGLNFLHRIEQMSRSGYEAMQGAGSMKTDLELFRRYTSMYGEEKAVQRIMQLRDPARRSLEKSREVEANKFVQGLSDQTIASEFTTWLGFFNDDYFWSRNVPTGFTKERISTMTHEFREFAREEFLQTADPERAKSAAIQRIKSMYGQTDVTGEKTLMRYPPENFFSGDDLELLKAKLQEDVKEAIAVHKKLGFKPTGRVILQSDDNTVRSVIDRQAGVSMRDTVIEREGIGVARTVDKSPEWLTLIEVERPDGSMDYKPIGYFSAEGLSQMQFNVLSEKLAEAERIAEDRRRAKGDYESPTNYLRRWLGFQSVPGPRILRSRPKYEGEVQPEGNE